MESIAIWIMPGITLLGFIGHAVWMVSHLKTASKSVNGEMKGIRAELRDMKDEQKKTQAQQVEILQRLVALETRAHMESGEHPAIRGSR